MPRCVSSIAVPNGNRHLFNRKEAYLCSQSGASSIQMPNTKFSSPKSSIGGGEDIVTGLLTYHDHSLAAMRSGGARDCRRIGTLQNDRIESN